MILWIKSVVEAARNPPSVVYATITIALIIMAVRYFTPNKLEKSFPHAANPEAVRNKKDNNKNSSNDLQHLFFIAIAVAEERWDGNGIVAGVRIAADTFGNDQPVNVCTGSQSDCCPSGI